MTSVSFPYEKWNIVKDVRPFRAASNRAFALVNGAIDIGDVPVSGVHPNRDPSIGPAEEEVHGLLMSCVEWLRERGLTTTELQQGFNRTKKKEAESPEQRLVLSTSKETDLPSDPRNIQPLIDKNSPRVNNF